MSLQLLVIDGPDVGRVFTLHPGDDNILGRSKDALYQVNDLRASRSHCQVIREGDRVTLVCLGGSGGTWSTASRCSKRSAETRGRVARGRHPNAGADR